MHRFEHILLFLGLFLAAVAPAQAQADDIWVRTWASAPSDEASLTPLVKPLPIEDVTIRSVVRLSAGGDRLRLRLSNELGSDPLAIGAVHVALRSGGKSVPGSDRAVTFAGAAATVIPAGGPAISDPVALSIPPLADLVVSIHVKGPSRAITAHLMANATSELFFGDRTAATDPADGMPTFLQYILTGVDVAAHGRATGTIVALGDSITDGAGSSYGANRRWTNLLAARLAEAGAGGLGVANSGISGNRLLRDGYGSSVIARLDRDVLSVPNVRYLIVFIGINDIGQAVTEGRPPPKAEDLIAGYRQIIARAHGHGIRVIGATLTPFAGSAPNYYSANGEAVRRQVNAWIRDSGSFDAVIDFAEMLGAPGDPNRMNPAFDSGDRLHPSDTGYATMAKGIDLTLFGASSRP